MATNIDKALYQNPVGIEESALDEAPIEIEIIDPEAVDIHAGDLSIHMEPGEEEEGTIEDFDANLADFISDGALQSIAGDLDSDIDADKASRKDWEKAYTEGLKLLGLQYEERTEPWNGACGVFHPMITEAVVRFQSEAITETFPAQGPVRTKILGKQTPEKQSAAVRVENDMNYELTEVMKEFRPEHERMLWSLPATGSAFKKVYYDPSLGRQVSMFIPAEDMILPYGTTDLDTCFRVTHVMRKTENEIKKLMAAGFYRAARHGRFYYGWFLGALMFCMDLVWFPNAGTYGSIPLYCFIPICYVVFLFDGWKRVALSVLTVLNVVAIILESVHELHESYEAYFHIFDLISVMIFTAEYVLRVWSYAMKYSAAEGGPWRGRKEYIFSFYGFIDFFGTLPFYLQLLFPGLDLRFLLQTVTHFVVRVVLHQTFDDVFFWPVL